MSMLKKDLENLQKRYLLWLYKTTKEALDKIERKFTQLEIDYFLLKELKKQNKNNKFSSKISEWENYIKNKENEGQNLKYDKEGLQPEYEFLSCRLKAIEKAIMSKFGRAFLKEVKKRYEEEMMRRIIEERQSTT